MIIKIPWTKYSIAIGKKDVDATKQSFGFASWQNTFGNFSSSGVRVNYDTLYILYNSLVDIRSSVRAWHKATAREGYVLVNKNNPKAQPNQGEVETFNWVFEEGEKSFFEFKRNWMRNIGITGNDFWHVEKNTSGQPLSVKSVDPRTMVVVADRFGNVIEYIQRVWGQEPIHFKPDEIVHSTTEKSTKNQLYGASPIEQIIWDSKAELNASFTNFYFYENNGVPAHLLIMEEKLTSEQYEEVKEKMDKQFKGAKNKYKAGLVPFLKDIKTIAPNQREMQYLETRVFNTNKISVAFGVDKFVLGYTEKVQRGNADVIWQMFYDNTIRPWEKYLEELFNDQLMEMLGLTEIAFKVVPSNYENPNKVAATTREDVKAGIITVNEARQRRGLQPADNEFADELMFNGILLDDLGEETKRIFNLVLKERESMQGKMINLLDE